VSLQERHAREKDDSQRPDRRGGQVPPLESKFCLSPQCGFAPPEEGNVPRRGGAMGEASHDSRKDLRRGVEIASGLREMDRLQRTKSAIRAEHVGVCCAPRRLGARAKRERVRSPPKSSKQVEDARSKRSSREQEGVPFGLKLAPTASCGGTGGSSISTRGRSAGNSTPRQRAYLCPGSRTRRSVSVVDKVRFLGHPHLEHSRFRRARQRGRRSDEIRRPATLHFAGGKRSTSRCLSRHRRLCPRRRIRPIKRPSERFTEAGCR